MAYLTGVSFHGTPAVHEFEVPIYDATKEPLRHLILTGPNGSGKSTTLRAISQAISALGGQAGGRESVIERANHHSVSTDNSSKNVLSWNGIDLVLSTTLAQAVKEAHRMVRVHLSAARLLRPAPAQPPSGPTWPLNAPPDADVSAQLLQVLAANDMMHAYATRDGDLASAAAALQWRSTFEEHLRAIVGIENLKIEIAGPPSFRVRLKSGDHVFEFAELADGHGAALSVVAALLIRYQAVKAQAQEELAGGIVLIDEIETHLHLRLQQQILPMLVALLPDMQFVVATHSPAVIASIDNAVVFDLETRSATMSRDYRGVPYGGVMTEHFGLSSDLDVDSTERLRRYRELASLPFRTVEQEQEMVGCAHVLMSTSSFLALQVWMVTHEIGGKPKSEEPSR